MSFLDLTNVPLSLLRLYHNKVTDFVFAELAKFGPELSAFSLPKHLLSKQYSARFLHTARALRGGMAAEHSRLQKHVYMFLRYRRLIMLKQGLSLAQGGHHCQSTLGLGLHSAISGPGSLGAVVLLGMPERGVWSWGCVLPHQDL